MAKKFNIDAFMELTPEEQAKYIEKQTNELVKRLPTLKKKLSMYNDMSSEMYNLKQEEVELQGSVWSNAIRGGQVTTPSSKMAYKHFVSNLMKYARTDISKLSSQASELRIDSWIEHINASSTESDKEYAQKLLDSMTDEEKMGFTRSKYFMDSSYMYMVTEVDGVQYSIQTLKLELYLEEVRGKTTQHIYRDYVKGSEEPLRKYAKPKIRR